MSELITLKRGNAEADIDLQGAWLTRLQIAGQDVLFPRQTFTLRDGSTKLRGGSHVCFPNFGPGGASGLPQHGFARTSLWSAVVQSADAVELALVAPEGSYTTADVRLTYELREGGIDMSLSVQNNGPSMLSICPAFHPYFATTAIESTVNDISYAHSDLGEAVFLNGSVNRLETGGRQFVLQQQNLPQWVLWTDGLGGYVCLEPTAAGNGFQDDTTLQLQTGGGWQSRLDIRIK